MSTVDNDYTPTTEEIRNGFAHSFLGDSSEIDPENVVALQLPEFDRWLTGYNAARDAETRAATLTEAAAIATDHRKVDGEPDDEWSNGADSEAKCIADAILAAIDGAEPDQQPDTDTEGTRP